MAVWDERQDSRLIELYASGATFEVMADELGRAISGIHQRLERLRAAGADLPPRKPRWTERRRALLARRRAEGATLRQLEREFGITRGTLTYQLRVLRRLGLDYPPVREPLGAQRPKPDSTDSTSQTRAAQ